MSSGKQSFVKADFGVGTVISLSQFGVRLALSSDGFNLFAPSFEQSFEGQPSLPTAGNLPLPFINLPAVCAQQDCPGRHKPRTYKFHSASDN